MGALGTTGRVYEVVHALPYGKVSSKVPRVALMLVRCRLLSVLGSLSFISVLGIANRLLGMVLVLYTDVGRSAVDFGRSVVSRRVATLAGAGGGIGSRLPVALARAAREVRVRLDFTVAPPALRGFDRNVYVLLLSTKITGYFSPKALGVARTNTLCLEQACANVCILGVLNPEVANGNSRY